MKWISIIAFIFCTLFFTTLSAQTNKNSIDTFYKNRVLKAPETVFKKFIEAGMQPTHHELTEQEQAIVDQAFSILPPMFKKILKDHLLSISFMDNMPNTALTSTLETDDSTQLFNITFRAGILHETISEWATWKEKSAFDFTANPSMSLQIDAGNLDAIQYVLLHEATHVVDAVLKLSAKTNDDGVITAHTAFSKNTWHLFNEPIAPYNSPLLQNTRFRSGKQAPIANAQEIYKALKKTPFSSLYGMASCYEDIAELVSIYHFTIKLKQPFVIYIKENNALTAVFEPKKNKLVRKRYKLLNFMYKETAS